MTNTPIKFPNKSDNSKLLSGIMMCNVSNIIDKNTRYIIIKYNRLVFLYVKKPMTDNKKKAYK